MRLWCFLSFILLFSSCKKNTIVGPPNSINNFIPLSQPVTTRIFGYLTTDQNTIFDSTVTYNFTNYITSISSRTPYFLSDEFTSDQYGTTMAFVVTSWSGGTLQTYKTVPLTPSPVNYIHYKTITANHVADVSNLNANTISILNGIQVYFPSGTLFYNGNQGPYPIADHIPLYAYYYDPTVAGTTVKMPAYYAGMGEGKNYFLKSFGTLMLRATNGGLDDGLNIYEGKPVSLSIPIPQTLLSQAPDSLPSWLLRNVGLWQKGAIAKKVGNNYEVKMPSLGYILLALPMEGAYINLELLSPQGSPVINSTVVINFDEVEIFEGQTDGDGHLIAFLPVNKSLSLAVPSQFNNNQILFAQQIGPFSGASDLSVKMTNVSNMINVKGTATTCSGQPIDSGLIITHLPKVSYVPIKNGQFDASFMNFEGNNVVTMQVLDLRDNTKGFDTGFVAAASAITTVHLNTCPENTSTYGNYTMDGVAGTVTGDMPQSYNPFLISSIINNETLIDCDASSKGFTFMSFPNTVGTFTGASIDNLFINGILYMYDVTMPIKLVYTRFDVNIGGYIEGSIDVYCKDASGGSHHLIGNFRVKRIR